MNKFSFLSKRKLFPKALALSHKRTNIKLNNLLINDLIILLL